MYVPLTSEIEMKEHARAIVRIDPAFIPIIKASPLCTINRKRPRQGHYETLITSIISQQLAVKAADTIEERVRLLTGGLLTPDAMAKLSAADLRTAGVSGAKARAIGELTEAALSGAIEFKKISKLSNEEISAELTSLWGIGPWTVEMFLMFHLGRLDLWPVGDLAMRRGWEKIHKLKTEIHPKKLDLVRDKFAGRQSIVAWYCWRASEGNTSSW
jgi:DNA-3-methyladenine glycosylase II